MPKRTEFHAAMARALDAVAPRVVSLDRTASTMDDARVLARDGAPDGSVVVADHQTSGRGRLGRAWSSEPGAALQATWVVRPSIPVERWTLIPLLAGVAVAEAARDRTRVEAVLKWPNDVLVGGRKLAGILTEAEPPAFVLVGLGVNVSQTSFPDLPHATSIAIEGGIRLDRADLLAAVLDRFRALAADPDAGLERYRKLCETIGRHVRVITSGGAEIRDRAVAVDERGALVLGSQVVAAGDVEHVVMP